MHAFPVGTPMSLRSIKLVHTIVWVFFVACIAGIPVMAAIGNHTASLVFVMAVTVEVMILAFNGGRCPLTDVAGRYTSERRDNFDIYLPLWVARHNKQIFGTFFVAGTGYAMARRWGLL
jgi:hypothetical protein